MLSINDPYQNWRLIYHRRHDVRVYTNITLVFLSIALLIFLAIQPTIITIYSLMKDIKEKRELLDQMNLKIKRIKQLQKAYLSINDNLNLVNDVYPDDASPAYLGRVVKVIAAKHNLTLKKLNLSQYQWPLAFTISSKNNSKTKGKRTRQKVINLYKVDASLSGSYQDLVGFIRDIDQSREMITTPILNFHTTEKNISLDISLFMEAKNDKVQN